MIRGWWWTWGKGAEIRSQTRETQQAAFAGGAALRMQFRGEEAVPQQREFNHAMAAKGGDKIEIFFPARNQLGNGEIVDLKAERRGSAGEFAVNRHETVLPAGRNDCGFRSHAMRVVAERLFKGREFPNRTINEIRGVRVVRAINIGYV